MAAEEEVYSYNNIEIYRHLTIGSGSYGKVFHAKADDLPCAAKILHPTLFSGNSSGGNRILEKFFREINVLKRIRHPNIVLYLKVIRDEDTGFPILLMEKIDENLTSFLERSRTPVPFRTQVDICCDVALAVAYLHSHSIVHRDLSSGNILIVAGAKAKVTDFGMCRFMEKDAKMSSAPGTIVYMPPEAFSSEPEYRDKIDCFSFGPLIIQIITGKYPNPKPLKPVMNDALYPMGFIPLESEAERRREHINLVRRGGRLRGETHPLLNIALECLENRPEDRPKASELCQRFTLCKTYNAYRNEQPYSFECSYASDLGEDHTFSSDNAGGPPRLPPPPPPQPTLHKDLNRTPRPIISGSATTSGDLVFFRPDESNEILAYSDKERRWLDCFPSCPHMAFTLVDILGVVTAVGGCVDKKTDTNILLSLVQEKRLKGERGGGGGGGGGGEGKWRWESSYPPMPSKRRYVAASFSCPILIVAGGTIRSTKKLTRNVEIFDTDNSTWYVASELPYPLSQSVMAVCGQLVYLVGGCDEANQWVKTTITFSTTIPKLREASHPGGQLLPPELPQVWETAEPASSNILRSAPLSLGNRLVIVCGRDNRDNHRTRDIQRYDHLANRWEVVGGVSVGRTRCLVAPLSGYRVMVVGGWIEGKIKTDSYEIISLDL